MQKFVIIAEIRSGYQLLATAIESHPNCRCFGEIFGSDKRVRQQSLWQENISTLADDDDPEIFLDQTLFPHFSKNKAVGFKLNYVCARGPEWKHLWQKIRVERWKIIHLTRSNLLNRYLSQKLAIHENNWQNNHYEKQVEISFEELQFNYNRSKKWQAELRAYFKNNDILEIEYKSIIDSFDKIQSHIGVQPRELNIVMKKQRNKRQSKHISNYRELYLECLKRNQYSEFFEDALML